MIVNDLIVTGDARIIGNLYVNNEEDESSDNVKNNGGVSAIQYCSTKPSSGVAGVLYVVPV